MHRALDSIRQKFKRVHGPGSPLDLDYLVYCPDHRIHNLNAAALDLSRIVDAGQRDGLGQRIEQVLGGGIAHQEYGERVLAFFRQTFEIVPDIHAHLSQQEKAFTRLTGPLLQLLSGLEMRPLRLRILGTAGSGKSLIAHNFFRKAIASGKRPLLVCYNRPLGEKLRTLVPTGGMATTCHGFCDQFLKSRGIRPDYTDWAKVFDQVTGEPVPEEWKYDTLIVDEGQDFEPEWVEILRLFLRGDPDIVWLEDPDQNVYDRPSVALSGFITFRAKVNYRTPRSIARAIQEKTTFDFEAGNPLPGLSVGETRYADPADQPGLVARLIESLLRQGFDHGEIALLTLRGVHHSIFSDRERVGNYRLRRFSGEYDLLGNQILTAGQITFDSVRRFKGQQAPAIILVDCEAQNSSAPISERLLYTGMTRATVRLEIVQQNG